MSSTVHQLNVPPAPWKSKFEEHIAKLDSPEFILASLKPSESSPVGFAPRARFCIYRGMWTELPPNKHNEAPKNEQVFESELPTFTSDVRMSKIPEIFATGPGKGDVSQSQGSGGGGPVEAVYWIKEIQVQWRIKGTAWVVARDIEGEKGTEESSGVRSVKSEIGARMRVAEGMEGKEGDWSWSKELTGHFGNCSPGMRGTWRNPPPGKPMTGEPDKDHQLGQKVQDLNDEIARSNFRVVIIKPDEVEMTDIADPNKSFRIQWVFNEKDGKASWSETKTWP